MVKQSAVGFEFRIHDNCPLTDIKQYMKTICLVAASVFEDNELYTNKKNDLSEYLRNNRAINDKTWSKTLIDVSGHGCFVPVSKTFTSKIYGEKCFPRLKNTKESRKNGEMDNKYTRDKSAYSLLCQINSDLFDKYGEHPIYKILDDNKEKQAPQPVNRNEAYWNKCFDEIKERMEQKPQTRGLLDHIAKKLLNISEKEKGSTFDKKLINEYMKNWKDDIYYLCAYYLK